MNDEREPELPENVEIDEVSDLLDVEDLLELAAAFGPVVQLRKFSSSTLIVDLSSDMRAKLRLAGIFDRSIYSYDRIGDRVVWRARIGNDSEWHVGEDPARALAEAISRYAEDEDLR